MGICGDGWSAKNKPTVWRDRDGFYHPVKVKQCDKHKKERD